MRVEIVATGSSGNVAIVDDFIVIDAGWPDISSGEVVLLTHSHTDHTRHLDKAGGLPVYCTTETSDGIAQKWPFLAFNRIAPGEPLVLDSQLFRYDVLPIEVVHDVPCVGFEIRRTPKTFDGTCGGESCILWLTDFHEIVEEGYVINQLRAKRYDHVYIECNNTLSIEDINDIYIGESVPKDEFHRRKSFQNHCNVQYLIRLFTEAGYTESNRYNDPVTLIHRSTYYYMQHCEYIVELCKIANVTNPLFIQPLKNKYNGSNKL